MAGSESVCQTVHTCAGMVHDWSITDVTHLFENLSVKIVPTGLKAKTLWK